ncbi:MAG: potassium transporter TrkG, partial [Pseudomonadota bacterium]
MPKPATGGRQPGKNYKPHPATLVLVSFLSLIALGTLLLILPVSTRDGAIPPMDALFTATSAVCVTGLAVLDTGTFFSPFGQAVILVLIQLGGLGVMTFSVILFRWIGKAVSFKQRMVLQNIFSHSPRKDIYHLLFGVLAFTAAAETAGAVLLFFRFAGTFPPGQALWSSVFHSVSAFCNAGFSLYPDSMTPWGDDLLMNAVMGTLIIIGGLGFPVLYELWNRWTGRDVRRKLSVQTRTVLWTSGILVVAGAVLFALLEREASLTHTSFL